MSGRQEHTTQYYTALCYSTSVISSSGGRFCGRGTYFVIILWGFLFETLTFDCTKLTC